MAQYECFKSDLYDHREDICRYGTLELKKKLPSAKKPRPSSLTGTPFRKDGIYEKES